MRRLRQLAMGVGLVAAVLAGTGCFDLLLTGQQSLDLLTVARQARANTPPGLDPDAVVAAAIFNYIQLNNMTGAQVANQVNLAAGNQVFSSSEGDLVVQVANLPNMNNYSTCKCLKDRLTANGINAANGYQLVAQATLALNTGAPAANPTTCAGIPTPQFTTQQVQAAANAAHAAGQI